MSADRYIAAAELAEFDVSPEDVRRLCPHAIEFVALDGIACWLREDLEGLLREEERP